MRVSQEAFIGHIESITTPIIEVKEAYAAQPLQVLTNQLPDNSTTQRLRCDAGSTEVRDLGLILGGVFGTIGAGTLATDVIVSGKFEAFGWGSLGMAAFGGAIALREVLHDR